MTDELTARLRAVFVDILDLDRGTDVEHLALGDIAARDPIAHLTLVAAIEDEFDVEFDTDQVIHLGSFTDARELLAAARGD